MSTASERLFSQLPERLKPLVSQGYHLLHPTASWRHWRRRRRTEDQVADRFFEDGEYDRLAAEFFDGRITDICMSAAQEVEDPKVIYDAHRDVAAKLYALVVTREPDVIVESGVYSGVSTTALLLGLDAVGSGRLYSVDDSRERDAADRPGERDDSLYARGRPSCAEYGSHALPPGKEPGWIIPDDLRERWDLRTGSSRALLPELFTELGGVDLFLHDSEHSTARMLFEFELAWEWLRPGGLVVSSHVDQNDAFETFVAERDAEHGLLSFEYLADSEYDEPCSCGYAIKPEA